LSTFKLGENYPSATRNTMFKVIRQNIYIAIRGLLDCVQIWYRVSSRHRRYAASVQGQRSKVKVTA